MNSRYSFDRNDPPIALLVEDDDSSRMEISGYLREKGYGVFEARTSVEALLLAVEFPSRIDALFTSLDLRKYCNGAELAGCLRASRPEIAVFYLCGNREYSEEVTREIVLGQATLLRKPISGHCMEQAIGMIKRIETGIQLETLTGNNF